ncbi:MAG: type II toxin-antitoxin system PemK/MazF family toxin [Nocardioides sp.]|jgi:hypothetical protein
MSLLRRLFDALLSPRASQQEPSESLGFNPEASLRQSPGPDQADAETDSDQPIYAPSPDGEPDPGEVVWGWVAYEEDASQGKDRPVLLLYREDGGWAALQLSSQDHDRDAADEARWGRYWMDVGSGGWDPEGRPSEVRLDRLLHLPADGIRREGAALAQEIFDRVVEEARRFHDWPHP